MPDVELAPAADGGTTRLVDRRTLLVGAAGALAAAGLGRPTRAAGYPTPVAAQSRPRFDPALERRLQRSLRTALRDPGATFPGAILHVRSARLGAWTGVAGLGRVAPDVPMRRADRVRAGSIVKTFVAVVVLQLAERRRLSLDAPLPELLPASVAGRFPNAADISVRMLLAHRSGIPEWISPAVHLEVARNPAKVWKASEFLDLAAAQPPMFAPGAGFFYSNTDYTLLGLIIERVTGRSWRRAVTRGVIRRLGLTRTYLPAPGQRSIKRPYAHGYDEVGGERVDLTRVDPSMAGAAGGAALVTTVTDLARFVDGLLKGRLFRRRRTLEQMLAFRSALDVGGLVGYGLGIERRVLPGGVELIGHLGGAPGYRTYAGRVRPQNVTMTFALNSQDDPTPLVVPAVQALAATRR
jgi:D-alanyl-D-alanine carboxypeptidase